MAQHADEARTCRKTSSSLTGWTRVVAALVASGAICGLVACGGGAPEDVVVRVNGSAITKAALSHWMAVMAPEHAVPDPPRYGACIRRQETFTPAGKAELLEECRQQYRALKLQALSFLISSHWLLGEAAEKGLSVSRRQVQEQVAKIRKSASSGDAQVEGDGTRARGARDIAFQARAELAAATLRQSLIRAEPAISQADVARRYRRDINRFRVPERRDFEIVEKVVGEAAARKILNEIQAGKRKLTSLSLSESVTRPHSFADVGEAKQAFFTALFAARPHVLVGPLPFLHYYALFEITKITPARVQSLARVRGAIENSLSRERRRRTLARFIVELRSKWTAKTDCARGYVVQKCSQYTKPRTPEDPLALAGPAANGRQYTRSLDDGMR